MDTWAASVRVPTLSGWVVDRQVDSRWWAASQMGASRSQWSLTARPMAASNRVTACSGSEFRDQVASSIMLWRATESRGRRTLVLGEGARCCWGWRKAVSFWWWEGSGA